LFQQVLDRGADQYFIIAGLGHRITGDGGNARDQRLAEADGTVYGSGRADVLADHADICGQAAGGHFAPGQNLDKLLFAAGGVFGRKADDLNARAFRRFLHHSQGFRLVVLNADQGVA
jgi:hypothetical protein